MSDYTVIFDWYGGSGYESGSSGLAVVQAETASKALQLAKVKFAERINALVGPGEEEITESDFYMVVIFNGDVSGAVAEWN